MTEDCCGDCLGGSIYLFSEYNALTIVTLIKAHFFFTNNNVKCISVLPVSKKSDSKAVKIRLKHTIYVVKTVYELNIMQE